MNLQPATCNVQPADSAVRAPGLPMARPARTARRGNPCGTGTRTKGINAPVDFWQELGRAAMKSGVSIGDFLRRLTVAGAAARDPQLAARLRAALLSYYGPAVLASQLSNLAARGAYLFLLGAVLVHGWLAPDEVVRRRCGRRCLGGTRAFCQARSTRQGQSGAAGGA